MQTPADSSGYPRREYAWTVVAILIATAVLSYTDRQVLSLIVDPIRAELHIVDTQMSQLFGPAFALVYGLAGLPLGLLADRSSRRNLIFAGVLVWSAGTLACGCAHSFQQLFLARMVVGLGEAVLSPAAISLISDYFPPARRGIAVGFFLSGIAMGQGASILIGGGVLHLVEIGALAHTPLASLAAWRLVLLLIGAPGLAWALVILVIREPARHLTDATAASRKGAAATADRVGAAVWLRAAPVYSVVAMASLVDNAVGAWSPSLFIRSFAKDAAQVGMQLGLLLTLGFGAGVLIGGWLADRTGARGGWSAKLGICLGSGLLLIPESLLINASQFDLALYSIPLYFALSGAVTACGFSAILDIVPNTRRGLAMAVSFFLNVALGGGLGPPAVTFASKHLFGEAAGLGPAIALTVGGCYAIVTIICAATLVSQRKTRLLAV